MKNGSAKRMEKCIQSPGIKICRIPTDIISDGIDTIGKKITIFQLYARQNSHWKNVKRSTEKGR